MALAEKAGIELVPVGDIDAFSGEIPERGFSGVVCVHPAMALQALAQGYAVGVYENATRPAEGGKPAFFASALHLYGVATNVEPDAGWIVPLTAERVG